MRDHRKSEALQPGGEAPEFVLPAINREGSISLDDYRGRKPVFVGLYRGLHCPFCRRHLANLNTMNEKLGGMGVETLAVVNTPPDRARLYFRYHPTSFALAADPDRRTHEAFGVIKIAISPEITDWPRSTTVADFMAVRIDPTGELPAPVSPFEANDLLNAKDGFLPTEADDQIRATHGTQLCGQFLIDRDGIIRWTFIEAERDPADIGKYPSNEEVLAAAADL